MDFTTIYLTIGAILIGLLAYLRHRGKQRSLTVVEPQPSPDTEDDGETFSDKFYCIRLNDGTCRSGYITDDASTSETAHRFPPRP